MTTGTGAKTWKHAGRMVRRDASIGAPPEDVWNAWTDPREIARWFVDRAEGRPRQGDVVKWIWEKFGLTVTLSCLEVDERRRLVLEGLWDNKIPTILEVTLERDGQHRGRTRVRVVQSGFVEGPEGEPDYRGVDAGWVGALSVLELYLSRYRGRDQVVSYWFTKAPFSEPDLADVFGEEAALRQWLTKRGRIGEPGSTVNLVLADGSTLTGRVLTRMHGNCHVSWDEAEGSLEFMAFGKPGEQQVGVWLHSWSRDPADIERIGRGLESAVARLAGVLRAGGAAPGRRAVGH